MCRDSYICAEIAVFVLNLSDIIFLRTAPHTHCATSAEFLRHSIYEAVSLNAIMTHESQRLYRKATFSEGFL